MSNGVFTLRVIVSGRVQGVFFRSSMKQVADENNVLGWVRNLKDGKVEALVQGRKLDVERVLEWCRIGPAGAKVDDVETNELEDSQTFRNFSILY